MRGMSNSKTKAGLVIFVVAWTGLVFLLLRLCARHASIERGEHRLLLTVGVSIPLLLVRLIYSLLTVFAHNPTFNMITGDVSVMLLMVILEQIFIVLVSLGIGLTLETRPPVFKGATNAIMDSAGENSSDYRLRELEGGSGQNPGPGAYIIVQGRPQRQRRGGPIAQLVGLAVDKLSEGRR